MNSLGIHLDELLVERFIRVKNSVMKFFRAYRYCFSSSLLGLMLTSGSIHWFLHMINIPIHIREICVFLAPFFSGLTAIATYLLTKELWSRRAGLFAAAFIAIAPGYSSRSVAGSYDNEGKKIIER